VNHEGLKLNGTHQLVVYTDGVNIVGGNRSTLNKKPEVLVVPRKEFCLEVNADKSMYIVMCWDQHAGQNFNIKIGNKYCGGVNSPRIWEQL
jgi:hypothetical protein